MTLKNQDNDLFYDKLGLVFIELPRFTKTEMQLESHLDKWLYFLKHLRELDAMPTTLQNDDVIARGFTMAELYALSDEDRQRYQDELKHYRDALNMLNTAHEEGREEGLQQGLQQALDRLVASGITEGQARRLLGLNE